MAIPESARRVFVGVNPRAGAQDRRQIVEELSKRLGERGLVAKIFEDVAELAGAAAEALDAGELRAVVAAGGDGTLRLIADRTPPGTPLAVLPLGTENLLARYLKHPGEAEALCQIVAEGQTVQLDAGRAGNQLFTLMAGCGFDAEVVRRLHQSRQGRIHHLSYAKPILDSILNYQYPELRVRYAPAGAVDGDLSEEIAARWVFVINVPRYAGGLVFSAGALGTDGLLDVCTFKEGSLLHGLMYLGGVMLGQHEGMQDFQRVQTRRLRVEAAAATPYQLDGDPGGELPMEICVVPKRLTMLVSRSWLEREELE